MLFSFDKTTVGKKYPLNNAGNPLRKLNFPSFSVNFNMTDQIVEPQDMSEGNIKTQLLNQLVIKDGKNENEFSLLGEWRYSQETLNKILENDEKIVISKIPFRPNHIKKGGEEKKIHNLLTTNYYSVGTYEDATNEQVNIFSKNYFDYVKPSSLIYFFIKSLTYLDKDSIILDFFSGSGTTADAVMQLNAEDGGNRKFIMVQIDEKVKEDTEAYKFLNEINKPTNICEIGKERIRRVGEKIKKEIEEKNKNLKDEEELKKVPDIGFKVFRTVDTNINWRKIRDISNSESLPFNEPDRLDFIENYNDKDIVYEVLLRQRDLPLSEKLETLDTIGNRTYLYASSYLICLETDITENLIKELADLNPLPIKFIFRDSAFKSDINLKESTFRYLKTLVEKNSGINKRTYTIEFI